MVGVKGRSGRRTHRTSQAMLHTFDQVADLTFKEAYQVLNDPSFDRLKVLQVCMPLALKRIPDKVITANVNMALSDELAKRIMAIMDTAKPIPLPPPEVYVTPITTSTSEDCAKPVEK